MQASLTGYILSAEEIEMDDKNKPGTKVQMAKLVLLDEVDGTTETCWITAEKPKGFNPKLVSKVVGPKVLATFKQTNFDGVKKTVLDEIKQV